MGKLMLVSKWRHGMITAVQPEGRNDRDVMIRAQRCFRTDEHGAQVTQLCAR